MGEASSLQAKIIKRRIAVIPTRVHRLRILFTMVDLHTIISIGGSAHEIGSGLRDEITSFAKVLLPPKLRDGGCRTPHAACEHVRPKPATPRVEWEQPAFAWLGLTGDGEPCPSYLSSRSRVASSPTHRFRVLVATHPPRRTATCPLRCRKTSGRSPPAWPTAPHRQTS